MPDSPGIAVQTERLDTLLYRIFKLEGDVFSVSRIVFHRILTLGIEDITHYDHRFERVEQMETGRLRVHFSNGTTVEGDLVVAADGLHSAVRKQFLPEELSPRHIGVDAIGGKIFLEEKSDLGDLEYLAERISMVTSTTGRSMFLAPQIYSEEARFEIKKLFAGVGGGASEQIVLEEEDRKVLIDDARDYLFYGWLTAHKEDMLKSTKGSSAVSDQDLVDNVLREMHNSGWAPELIDMVKKTDINSVGTWPLHAAPAIKTLSPYKPNNLTFLGDSIHASISPRNRTNGSASHGGRGREHRPSRREYTIGTCRESCLIGRHKSGSTSGDS
jgi:2-polyprenyl-6-methoxyphenol hydroxylase-like FAD-dependent oxidoreductase